MYFDVPLDLYRIFCTVVSTSSMSLAAKELYISQPAVSMAIKQLEKKYGRQLLVRSSKGVRVTAEGGVLYEYLMQGIKMIKTAEKKYAEMLSLDAGEIRIGASDTLLTNYLLPFVEEYVLLYPHINIKVTNKTSTEAINLLKKGEVDLAFVNLPIEKDDGIEIYECLEVTDCLIGGSKYRRLKKEGLDIKNINEYPILFLDGNSSTMHYLCQYAKNNGVTIVPSITLGSMDLLTKFTAINLGLSFGIKEFMQDEFQKGLVFEIPLTPPIPQRAVGLVKLKGVEISLAAGKFVDLINEDKMMRSKNDEAYL